jgi:hypothetical protein
MNHVELSDFTIDYWVRDLSSLLDLTACLKEVILSHKGNNNVVHQM